MPRTASADVRTALVEQAAEMLAAREPVSARTLAARVGASTTAVYTHFDGMPGLWTAVRQEGFARLATRLGTVARTRDPVRDVAALGSAYAAHALAHPHLYRAMFDAAADLPDPAVAAVSFDALVDAAARARADGRITAARPEAVATRVWAAGHGLLVLVLSGVLPRDAVDAQGPALVQAVLVAAGDENRRCRRSVRAGWWTS